MARDRSMDTKIWSIAWPAIVANISIPLLGLVDAALLGHLDSPVHLAAVAVGSAILTFLYWGFNFLRMGTTGEVARATGAGDERAAVLALGRSAILALAIAALLLLLREPLLALGLLAMGPAPEIGSVARTYGEIRLLSAPAVLLTFTGLGWFIGHQDTRWPLRILVATNLANILLDALLILGFGLASTGAAMATVMAEYFGLVIVVLAVRTHVHTLDGPRSWRVLLRWKGYGRVLKSNTELFLRTLTLLFAFAFFTAAGEALGTDIVAANAIMMQFLLFSAFALDGFAYAAEGLAGEALGRGDVGRFHAVTRRCGLWTAGAALVVSGVILLGRPLLFPLLTSLPAVLAVMQTHGLWLVLMPIASAPSYLLDGLFVGAGATRPMMVTMLLSALGVYLPLWYFTSGLGNHGLWLAFAAFNASRGVTLAWCYLMMTRHRRWPAPAPGPSA